MGFIADALQNTANTLHSVGINTPEMGWTESAGGASVPTTYKLPDGGTYSSPTGGSLQTATNLGTPYKPGVQEIDGKLYDFSGANPVLLGSAAGGDTGGDTGGAAGAVPDAKTVQANPLLAALASLDPARQTSRDRAQGDFDNTVKQYNDQLDIDRTRYTGQTTQNEQNLTGNRQAAMLQAAQGGQGLRAVLAAMGALNGTGSVLADRAIGQAANKDIGDAQNNFETNASTLQNAWSDTEAQDKQRRAQADAALQSSFNNADTSFYNNKIDILGKLANVYGADTSEGANYSNQAAGLYADVAKIPQGQAVSYTPVSSLYSPQNLAKYLSGTNNLQVKTQTGNSQPNSPSVVATVQKRKDELS